MTLWVLRALATVPGRFYRDQGFLLASALSFSLLACLAPLALLLLSVTGFLLESEQVAEYARDTAAVLSPAYSAEIAEALGVLARERKVAGLVGAGMLVVFATQLFALIRSVANRAFRVRVRRGVVHGFLFDVAWVVVFGALGIGFVVAIIVLATLGDMALRLVPFPVTVPGPLPRYLTPPLLALTGVFVLYFIYRTCPHTYVPPAAAATATVVVAVLWDLVRRGFVAYVERWDVYGRLYGSFGVVVATLIWIYYSAVLFVAGAELAAALTEGRAARRD